MIFIMIIMMEKMELGLDQAMPEAYSTSEILIFKC